MSSWVYILALSCHLLITIQCYLWTAEIIPLKIIRLLITVSDMTWRKQRTWMYRLYRLPDSDQNRLNSISCLSLFTAYTSIYPVFMKLFQFGYFLYFDYRDIIIPYVILSAPWLFFCFNFSKDLVPYTITNITFCKF